MSVEGTEISNSIRKLDWIYLIYLIILFLMDHLTNIIIYIIYIYPLSKECTPLAMMIT